LADKRVDMKKNEEKRPSESFILGVVALVFLIIGYQTSMFVYKSAVTKIAANRDQPDTIYVFERTGDKPDPDAGSVRTEKRFVRKNASHAPHAEIVRRNLPRKNIESFVFDPNTATEDDFFRLGFTPKQAETIVNYRKKGGRFRRKTDFAKSFVVSDSIYRRLEPYIDIPLLDLNLADSAAFDALPGIGGWFALKMMEHRERLKGYSYKEQLMDIWKFDRQKYDALEDLVTINPQTVTPYPLWSLPADSLRTHPYIGNYETARAIVLYRNAVTDEQKTIEGLLEAGILDEDNADKRSRCVIVSP